MIVLGADPGLHQTGLALYDATLCEVRWVGVARGPDKAQGQDAVLAMKQALHGILLGKFPDLAVVESQEAYLGGGSHTRKSTPGDLIMLATVTGLIVASAAAPKLLLPRPKDWKGQVPKAVQQARVCSRLNWPFRAHPTKAGGWVEPIGFGHHRVEVQDVRGTQWSHVLDAIGLAMHGAEQMRRA